MNVEIRRELARQRQLELAGLAQQEFLLDTAATPRDGSAFWRRYRLRLRLGRAEEPLGTAEGSAEPG